MGMGGGIRKGWDRDGVGSGRRGIRMGGIRIGGIRMGGIRRG